MRLGYGGTFVTFADLVFLSSADSFSLRRGDASKKGVRRLDDLRIPGHADHDSGLMAITIPGGWRSGFRDDGDRCSGLMPITFRPVPEC